MSARIYVEGGGTGPDSKDLPARAREGFQKLLEKCGFAGRMPRITPCGSRNNTFEDFRIAHASRREGDYIAMWIDSEEPVAGIEKTWDHLRGQGLPRPAGVSDEQVLFMTTCMETLIVADREALKRHYGAKLQESALPALNDLENRSRSDVQDKLSHATRNCTNAYAKGKRSFEVLSQLTPATLAERLPSFARCRRILGARCGDS